MKHILFICTGGHFLRFSYPATASVAASADTVFCQQTSAVVSQGIPLWLLPITIMALSQVITFILLLRQRKYSARQRHQLKEQLRLIRNLLDLCYTYGESPAVFLDKFKDKVNIRELKSYKLIERSKRRFSGLKEEESLLCQFLDSGFTHRELCVVYNLKSINCLYVKFHRLKKRLQKSGAKTGRNRK